MSMYKKLIVGYCDTDEGRDALALGQMLAQATGAEVVFADEPTGALDSRTSAEVMDALLWSTTGQGRTLVVVTHEADVAARCTRTIAVRDGRILGSAVNA